MGFVGDFKVQAMHCNDDSADLDVSCTACKKALLATGDAPEHGTLMLSDLVKAAMAHVLECKGTR